MLGLVSSPYLKNPNSPNRVYSIPTITIETFKAPVAPKNFAGFFIVFSMGRYNIMASAAKNTVPKNKGSFVTEVKAGKSAGLCSSLNIWTSGKRRPTKRHMLANMENGTRCFNSRIWHIMRSSTEIIMMYCSTLRMKCGNQ
uniref:Uncharacterized protein n=1 Tax=Photinus pyralis TaxID=7054 RepID=A0A1Y1KSF8_PHOPY